MIIRALHCHTGTCERGDDEVPWDDKSGVNHPLYIHNIKCDMSAVGYRAPQIV